MTLAALADHLWQSTLFAGVAGLLTLLFRKHYAQVRYRIWLAVSLKFLIPFSLLVAIGGRLALLRGPAVGSQNGLHIVVEVISSATSVPVFPSLAHSFPLFAGLWLCGLLAVVSGWCVQWRKTLRVRRNALPMSEGREVEALRRIQHVCGIRRPIEILLTHASLEPGVFGISQPVLLWPAGISERLGDAQLESILAHEIRHVCRRDNLAAAIHMVVEALFWFHPIVWWLGSRLIEERERACDEDVLELRTERQLYAEGILKVCEFCLASPLDCLSGVAGGDLKKRMVNIMTDRKLLELDFARRVLLVTSGLAVVAVPFTFGLMNASSRTAEAQTRSATASQEGGSGRLRATPGEMSKMLVKKVDPSYPDSAKKAGVQGKVVLTAIIGKEGNVENLQLVSGDPVLAAAAIDAVKQWKYRPYVQQGQAVEVETEIVVNFTLAK